MEKYVCNVCGYEYDPAIGDPDQDVSMGTLFEALPEEWICPLCGEEKDNFIQVGGEPPQEETPKKDKK